MAALEEHADAARAAAEKSYLKSELAFLGTGMPAIRRVTRAAGPRDREESVALAQALWAEPVHERRSLAIGILERHQKLLVPADLALLERLLRESRTWAYVDWLATTVVAPLVERHPKLVDELDRWSSDPDFWIRRSALLALLPPLRRGAGDWERFAGYADRMLEEREFFIRKAIGWVLREVSKKRPQLVYEWLLPRASRASGVTWREAVKYLSAEQNAALARAAPRSRRRAPDLQA